VRGGGGVVGDGRGGCLVVVWRLIGVGNYGPVYVTPRRRNKQII